MSPLVGWLLVLTACATGLAFGLIVGLLAEGAR